MSGRFKQVIKKYIRNILLKIRRLLYKSINGWYERHKDSQLRESMHSCGENVIIYHPVSFYGAEALDIGHTTSIAPFVHIWCGGRVIIGSKCMIGSHVVITSLTHDYNSPEMHKTIEAKPVVIDDEVWVGSQVVILPGVRIGKGAVIGAGSVVSKDVPEYAIVYGNPAAIKGYRKTGERK